MRAEAAYDPTALTGGTVYRWASGTTVRVFTQPDASGSSVDIGLAVRLAMSNWNAVPQFAEVSLVAATDIHHADVVVYDRAVTAPVERGACSPAPTGASGFTSFCPDAAIPSRAAHLPILLGGETSVTVVIILDKSRVNGQSAYNAVVAHEFGHALGIGAHSDNAADLMFGTPTVDAPSARDKATLRYVLGTKPALTL
jgi:hypothetical protein